MWLPRSSHPLNSEPLELGPRDHGLLGPHRTFEAIYSRTLRRGSEVLLGSRAMGIIGELEEGSLASGLFLTNLDLTRVAPLITYWSGILFGRENPKRLLLPKKNACKLLVLV